VHARIGVSHLTSAGALLLAAACTTAGEPGPAADATPGAGDAALPDALVGPVADADPWAPDSSGAGVPCAEPFTGTGEGTYYSADGSGNCSFPASPDDLMVGAMNEVDYGDADLCGACVHIDGPRGAVQVRIVDRCPECQPGDIDLSPQAFSQIADLVAGRIPISWYTIPCPVTGPVVYHFKDGSSQWWTAVQVRNHRHAIARFEARSTSGEWVELGRERYNYFLAAAGLGPGPYTFRTTDVHGQSIEDSGIPGLTDADAPGASQFPPCAP